MAIDISQAREHIRRRWEKEQGARNLRFTEAWRDFRAIVGLLVSKYRPSRIYQWGSLLDPRTFSEISDIDIAIEGITEAVTFFALYGEADRLTRFPLDLVELERLEPEFADIIRLKGVVVYDREQPDPGPHFRDQPEFVGPGKDR